MRKQKEIWADVPGYEDYYRVSTFGRVIAKPRNHTFVDKNGNKRTVYYDYRFIDPKPDSGNYQYVMLRDKDYNPRTISIHRLVAMTFIDNPLELPIVNHKDENPANNHVENLEWCTVQYNVTYGTAIERRVKTVAEAKRIKQEKQVAEEALRQKRLEEERQKSIDAEFAAIAERNANIIRRRGRIEVFRKNGRYVGIFNSIEEAKYRIGVTAKNDKAIKECLDNKREHAHGYEWYFEKWRRAGKYACV